MTSRIGSFLNPYVLALAAVFFLVAGPAGATDWPQIQGPRGDGSVEGAGLPDGPMRLETLWKTPLGSGYSGIAVAGGKAVTMYMDGPADYVAALDTATGEMLWRFEVGEGYQGHDGSDDGPLSTPLIHDRRVFAVSAQGSLFALSLDEGKPQWKVSLTDKLGAEVPEYGFTTSPIAAGGLVVVQVGGPDGYALCGFDPTNGEVRWKVGQEPAQYRTPVLVDMGGRPHLVMVGDQLLRGVDPGSGKTLWESSFDKEHGFGGVANIVPTGPRRFLVTGFEKHRLFEIVRKDGVFVLEEIWETAELKGVYNAPVYRDGLIFGYNGAYLTAVDVQTGERVWKSRPPGKGVSILVDDHLVIWAASGTVHVGPAGSEGFKAAAHIAVLETSSLTAPAFADGTIFVRNLDALAAVTLRAADRAGKTTELPEITTGTEFGKLLTNLGSSDDKQAAIERYLDSRTLPLVEDRRVHFIYRGEADDVGIVGPMTQNDSGVMQQVAGTDLFYRTFELDPDSRIEYAFVVDFGEERADPANPLVAPGSDGKRSELRMAGWAVPEFAVKPFDAPRGAMHTLEIVSKSLEETREVTVHVPPGYAESEQSYPLLVVMDFASFGTPGAKEHGRLPEICDRLAATGGVEAPIVAYVPFTSGFAAWYEGYASKRDKMLSFVADELVVEVGKRFRVREGRENHALFGAGWGAFPALYAGLNRSELFGKTAILSLTTYGPLNEELGQILDSTSEKPRLDVYCGWGTYDHDPEFGEHVDMPALNREMASMLAAHDHRVVEREITAGGSWGAWWSHVEHVLTNFF